MQSAVGINGRPHFTKLRQRVGDQFEHNEKTGPHRGVWVWVPGWIQAWRRVLEEAGRAAAPQGLTAKQRLDEVKLRNAELDLAEREGKLVDSERFFVDQVAPFCDGIRTGIEVIGRFPEAQRIMVDHLHHSIDRLQANGSTSAILGDRIPDRQDGGSGAAETAAKHAGVRRAVRDDAAGGAKGRRKVSE